jgi:UDP-glucose 4-epimerase
MLFEVVARLCLCFIQAFRMIKRFGIMAEHSARTLVTGGAGFIGSHLVEQLLNTGYMVRVLDNFSTGRRQNLAHLRDNPQLDIHEVDVANLEAISPLLEGIDWVFHMAALADIVPSIQHPLPYYHSNVSGTLSVLEAARAAKVKRFLYTASSSCYGLPDVSPTPESAPIRPMYPYALTKYLGEQTALHWGQVYGLPVVSLRLFNVYGPRSRTSGTYGAVFGVFLAQKLAGKPFTVVGDGTQTRDFTFVSDIVDAFITAARSDLSGEVFNVGSGKTNSVNRLVELLGGDVTFIPKRPGEPDCTFADARKIEQELNWRARVSFEDGVATMLENIDYWREAPVWTPNLIAEATRDWFTYLGKSSG